MFQVPRYDPKESDQRKPKTKSRPNLEKAIRPGQKSLADVADQEEGNAIHASRQPTVVAPEQPQISNFQETKKRKLGLCSFQEAVDDLDLNDLEDPIEPYADGDDVDAKPINRLDGPPESDEHETELQIALLMAQQPLEDLAKQWKLADFLISNLRTSGFVSFFPIQALVIPTLLLSHRVQSRRIQDICVAAPTGSGKTLAYVVPIFQALHESNTLSGSTLRALIVLPSRDLARQVHAVCLNYAQGSNLCVGLTAGQSSFRDEQLSLLCGRRSEECKEPMEDIRFRLELEPSNVNLVLETFWDSGNWSNYAHGELAQSTNVPQKRTNAKIDILVCTPGRLVDHLEQGNLSLEHLRFLVVDEADRLLSQSYHHWIDKVLIQVNTNPEFGSIQSRSMTSNSESIHYKETNPCQYRMNPVTWRHESLLQQSSSESVHRNPVSQPVQLQKLLVSATMTRDPQKLASLQLFHPLFFSLSLNKEKRYTLPPNLQEYTLECTAEHKPLVLLAVLLDRLHQQRSSSLNDSVRNQIVIFTSSVESTHRLTRLLQLLWASGVASTAGPASSNTLHAICEVSSSVTSLPPNERDVRLQSRPILICSDGLSRGIDLPSVSLVIHYDIPRLAKIYVHRCGRTARAGQSGMIISLIKKGQKSSFAKMRSLIVSTSTSKSKDGSSSSCVESMVVPKSTSLTEAIPTYRRCLLRLRRILEAEDRGDVGLLDEECVFQFLSVE